MNTKSSIFTNGGATSENITFVFMSEIKIDLTLKKSNFLFLLCFKIAIIKFIPMRQQSRGKTASFLVVYIKFDASSVFTGYDTGCKQSLQL